MPQKRLIIGVTGSFGSGKTTVAGIFKSFGAKVIDADRIAHRIIRTRSKIYKKIINIFGKGILKGDKSIDRYKLAQVVFNDKRLLEKLNRITHPEIIRIIKKKIKASKAKLVVLDAPLLIEAGLENLVDKLIAVKINRKQQIGRILKRTRIKKSEILKRIRYQIPLGDKLRLADFVIDNSGTIKKTKRQVRQIRRQLWKS